MRTFSEFAEHNTAILIVLLIGIIPFLWYRQGYVNATGDYYPYYAFSAERFGSDSFLWSSNTIGKPSAFPAYSLYALLWTIPHFFAMEIGLWETVLRAILLATAALSMLYLVKTIYPGKNLAGPVASFFYIFNFFALTSLMFNTGMMWTYAFLPLLTSFMVKVVTQTHTACKNIIYFGLVFTFVASISSINVANVALIILGLLSVLLYYVVIERKMPPKLIIKNLMVLAVISFLLSIWWIIPILNYYVLSPSTQLGGDVNVLSWSWTHGRASFLNIFWLNGFWGWRPEYVPYYSVYSSSSVLTILLFIPFPLISLGLLLKDKMRQFNYYIMAVILFLMFLAKGLHDPLGNVNLFLYNNIPYMNAFREPVSKFTLIMLPFLSFLAGFAVDKLARISIHHKVDSSKLFAVSLITIFAISTLPIIANPIETKTEALPYSAYVKIPQYWYETSEWLSSQTGDFQVLVTPLDDYYHLPYSWGCFTSDGILDTLSERPLINPSYAYSYIINPDVKMLMDQLRDAIRYNRTTEFQTLTSLLNIKYILQRNDLDEAFLAYSGRDMMDKESMRDFLQSQPNLILAKTIGEIDIYEYTIAQPYIHTLEVSQSKEYSIKITQEPTSGLIQWNFNSDNQLNDWKNATLENQFGSLSSLSLDNFSLKYELWNSTWGWKTINSPLISALYEARYNIEFSLRGENAHQVHIKIVEYDKEKQLVRSEYVLFVADGTFDWRKVIMQYSPKITNTTFLQLQIWNGHQTDKLFPNTIWIDDIEVQGYVSRLNTAMIQQALDASKNDSTARIAEYGKVTPTKIILKVNSSRPFILTINEAYDSNWRAYLDGDSISAISIFSVMNGFQINKTGQFEVTIEYEPQNWFYAGSVVSTIAFVACIAYLIFRHVRKDGSPQKSSEKPVKPE